MVEATTPNASRDVGLGGGPDHHGNQGYTTDPVANQYCISSAQGVPSEVLEGEYGHSFGIWGLGYGPLRPSPRPPRLRPRGGGGGEG